MCDMQKMPSREDASCEEDEDMNFATFSPVGGGTHFVTANGQLQKIQQNVANNGATLQQVVGMVGTVGEGVQYVRTLDAGASLQSTPQLISVPIALPGSKPGDPQQMVQIQVLTPQMLQAQQQPKFHTQIPIHSLQGFQQGGTVLTLSYSPDNNEAGGIQILGNTLPEGVQVVQMPQEMQLVTPQQTTTTKQEPQPMHQVFITPNQQIIINSLEDTKVVNNNTVNNNNNDAIMDNIVIKEECDETTNDDESSQGTEAGESASWQAAAANADLIKYLNSLQPQQVEALPVPLQQFLKLNPSEKKGVERIQLQVNTEQEQEQGAKGTPGAVISEDGTLVAPKKKKKYKKKPARAARPKPGQVVIATAADGTPIYCCPECFMAYPDKEQLEMHLIVHKIERRFICGICGAGLKRKEHLERHKLGHNPERPFVCNVCCKGFKRREHLNLHTVIHSGVKTEMCGECGKGFYRKDHLRKHTRSHEHRRAKDEAGDTKPPAPPASAPAPAPAGTQHNNTILPEITIHVPTGGNVNVPVQINIPQHVVTSLAAATAHQPDARTLDALLAQHT